MNAAADANTIPAFASSENALERIHMQAYEHVLSEHSINIICNLTLAHATVTNDVGLHE